MVKWCKNWSQEVVPGEEEIASREQSRKEIQRWVFSRKEFPWSSSQGSTSSTHLADPEGCPPLPHPISVHPLPFVTLSWVLPFLMGASHSCHYWALGRKDCPVLWLLDPYCSWLITGWRHSFVIQSMVGGQTASHSLFSLHGSWPSSVLSSHFLHLWVLNSVFPEVPTLLGLLSSVNFFMVSEHLQSSVQGWEGSVLCVSYLPTTPFGNVFFFCISDSAQMLLIVLEILIL